MAVKLGDKVKDTVTGFQGIAVARTTWLHGCDRINVQPVELDKDKKPLEAVVFDEKQLIVVKAAVVASEENKKSTTKTGGPRDDKAALRRN